MPSIFGSFKSRNDHAGTQPFRQHPFNCFCSIPCDEQPGADVCFAQGALSQFGIVRIVLDKQNVQFLLSRSYSCFRREK